MVNAVGAASAAHLRNDRGVDRVRGSEGGGDAGAVGANSAGPFALEPRVANVDRGLVNAVGAASATFLRNDLHRLVRGSERWGNAGAVRPVKARVLAGEARRAGVDGGLVDAVVTALP